MEDDTFSLQVSGQLDQCSARVEMPFTREEQTLPETSGQIGFQRINACLIDCVEGFRPADEATQLAGIARVRQDERAFTLDSGDVLFPPAECFLPKPHDGFFGAFALAPWRQHAARKPRTAIGADLRAAGNDCHSMALIGELGGGGKTGHTRSDNGDAHQAISSVRVFQRPWK